MKNVKSNAVGIGAAGQWLTQNINLVMSAVKSDY